MSSNFYGCFRHEKCGSEDCSKMVKFWAKLTSQEYRSGDVDDFQRRSRFAQKGHSWVHGMAMALKPKPNHPVLLRLRRSKKSRNSSRWPYQKARFRSVSRIGKHDKCHLTAEGGRDEEQQTTWYSLYVCMAMAWKPIIPSFCYDWEDKRKIEIAVDDTRKWVWKVFLGLEKTLA